MKKTQAQQIEQIHVELALLRLELDSYIHGDWRYEYYMSIGYNKIFTGRKIYRSDPLTNLDT